MTSATKPVTLSERETRAGAARVRYLTGGDGDAMILVHGLGGSAENWIELAPELARRHRVLVPDLPGHGGSEPAPLSGGRGATHLGPYADAVLAAAAAEGIERAVVVGHSLGGVVALRLALARPELVRGLVLCSPAGITSSTRPARIAIAVSAALRPGRVVAPFRHRLAGRAWYRSAVFGRFFASDAATLSPRATIGFLEGTARHTDMRGAGRALVADDPRLELDDVRAPSLVLWGARDPQLPLDDAFEYTRRLGARLRVIADCGHLAIGERPDACLDAIELFAGEIGP